MKGQAVSYGKIVQAGGSTRPSECVDERGSVGYIECNDDSLQKSEIIDGGATPLVTFLNIIKNILGAGILALPYAFSTTGWLLGAILMCCALTLAVLSLWFILQATEAAKLRGADAGSYRGLAQCAWGSLGAYVVDFVVASYSCGLLICYGRLIVEYVSSAVDPLGLPPVLHNGKLVLFVTGFVLVPLCAVERIEFLKRTSVLGSFVIVYAVALVFVTWLYVYGDSETNPEVVAIKVDVSAFQGVSIFITSFSFHFNMPVYYRELAGRTPKRMMSIIAAVYTYTISMFVFMCVGGYVRFGSNTKSNILENLPDDSPVVACRVLLSAMIMTTYPIIAFGTRGALSRSLLGTDLPPMMSRWLLALGVVFVPLAVASTVPNIGVVLAFNSALFGVAQQIIIPASLFLTLTVNGVDKKDKQSAPGLLQLFVWGILLVAFCIAALGFMGTILTMAGGSDK